MDAYTSGGYASYADPTIAWNGSAANAFNQFQPGSTVAASSAMTTIVNSDLKQHFADIKPHLVTGKYIDTTNDNGYILEE